MVANPTAGMQARTLRIKDADAVAARLNLCDQHDLTVHCIQRIRWKNRRIV